MCITYIYIYGHPPPYDPPRGHMYCYLLYKTHILRVPILSPSYMFVTICNNTMSWDSLGKAPQRKNWPPTQNPKKTSRKQKKNIAFLKYFRSRWHFCFLPTSCQRRSWRLWRTSPRFGQLQRREKPAPLWSPVPPWRSVSLSRMSGIPVFRPSFERKELTSVCQCKASSLCVLGLCFVVCRKVAFSRTGKARRVPIVALGSSSLCASSKTGKVWAHKCAAKLCRKYIQPHDFHPIFHHGRGASYTPLGYQAAVLCCALAGVPATSAPVILGMNHKPVSRIYNNLEITRSRHVLQKQKEIHFGARHKWCDVEADEVDVGKEVDLHHNRAKWEQWGGIVERGQRSTLVLFRLPPKTTAVRSPGPGPNHQARLETHCSEVLGEPRCDLAYWWCQDLQDEIVRRAAWQCGAQEEAGPREGKACVGETSLHQNVETQVAKWQERNRESRYAESSTASGAICAQLWNMLRVRPGPSRLPVEFEQRSGRIGIVPRTFGMPPARCWRICASDQGFAVQKRIRGFTFTAVAPLMSSNTLFIP